MELHIPRFPKEKLKESPFIRIISRPDGGKTFLASDLLYKTGIYKGLICAPSSHVPVEYNHFINRIKPAYSFIPKQYQCKKITYSIFQNFRNMVLDAAKNATGENFVLLIDGPWNQQLIHGNTEFRQLIRDHKVLNLTIIWTHSASLMRDPADYFSSHVDYVFCIGNDAPIVDNIYITHAQWWSRQDFIAVIRNLTQNPYECFVMDCKTVDPNQTFYWYKASTKPERAIENWHRFAIKLKTRNYFNTQIFMPMDITNEIVDSCS